MTHAENNSWEGILAEGETILWQGRPAAGIFWGDLIGPQTLMGVFFTGFSVFWITMATVMSRGTDDVIGMVFPLFGLPFVAVGLYLLVGHVLWDAHSRARTWYTLTDRAAYIATATLGRRRLKRYGLDEMTRLDLDDTQPGSVWFAQTIQIHTSTDNEGMPNGRRPRITQVPIGFRRIDEARQVYRLLAAHRDGARQAAAPATRD